MTNLFQYVQPDQVFSTFRRHCRDILPQRRIVIARLGNFGIFLEGQGDERFSVLLKEEMSGDVLERLDYVADNIDAETVANAVDGVRERMEELYRKQTGDRRDRIWEWYRESYPDGVQTREEFLDEIYTDIGIVVDLIERNATDPGEKDLFENFAVSDVVELTRERTKNRHAFKKSVPAKSAGAEPFEGMLYGACYYPEHWDRQEWLDHARLMAGAGFNVVRLADFAWSKLEPVEGTFDFSWLDEAIDTLATEGIRVIMCTPTAAPPRWLSRSRDILMRDRYGRKREWGSRRECCANNREYRDAAARMVTEMARHYAGNPNIVAWQIDNEFGCHDSARCYCESCREKFASYLEACYGTVEELNSKWGTVFWSQTYDSFDDVILPGYNSCEPENSTIRSHNPSLDMEFMRFSSESWVEFARMEIGCIRREDPSARVTTNLMGHFPDIDYYRLAEPLDFVEWDNYPDTQWESPDYEWVSMAHEIMRGVKNKNFIVAEEQSGPCGWDVMGAAPEPGQIRLWVYQALAHGGEGILFFRFMAAPFGMEQYWYGILDHDGIPRRRYAEVQRIGRELDKVKDIFLGKPPVYDALLVRDYENLWSHGIKRHTAGFDYEELLYDYYRHMSHLGVMCAVGKGNYGDYRLVVMAAYNLVDPEELSRVTEYVREGGTLVVTFRSGQRNRYNNIERTTLPCAFAELCGIEIEEFDPLKKETHIRGVIESSANLWCDVIRPVSARVVSSYVDRHFKNSAAITVNDFGKGHVYYVGCDLDSGGMDAFLRMLASETGITVQEEPDGIEVVKREGCTILLNHTDRNMQCFTRGISLLKDGVFDGRLTPYGVEIIKGEQI